MTRNAECIGHPHSTHLGCGWRGERFPNVPMYQPRPDPLTGRTIMAVEWIDVISAKPCPRCGGIVLPIVADDVLWPAEVER